MLSIQAKKLAATYLYIIYKHSKIYDKIKIEQQTQTNRHTFTLHSQ